MLLDQYGMPIKHQRARRSYSAASTNTRLSLWSSNATSANTEVLAGAAKMRGRVRDLVRNNPHAASIVNSLAYYLIGTGIRPQWEDSRAQQLWDDWSPYCCADAGGMDVYGLESLAVRAWSSDGGVLMRRYYRRRSDGLPVPISLQVLEEDYLDGSKDGVLRNGRRIVGGIEFDRLGNRTGYWMLKEHPGEQIARLSFADTVFVRADSVAHLYQETRPGQVRSVSMLAPVVAALWDLGGYQDAERMRKRGEACYMAAVTGGDPDDVSTDYSADGIGDTSATDASGNPIDELQPGMIAYLPPYKEITFNAPKASPGYAEFIRTSLHEITAGAGLPYEIGTGDLTQVNFSSIRMGMIRFRLMCKILRQQVIIPMFCRPLARWFIDAAQAANALPVGRYDYTWSEPAIEEVDRLKDAAADQQQMRDGTASWHEIVAAKGKNPEKLLEEIAAERARFKELGVKLDSDPNQSTMSGDSPAVRAMLFDMLENNEINPQNTRNFLTSR